MAKVLHESLQEFRASRELDVTPELNEANFFSSVGTVLKDNLAKVQKLGYKFPQMEMTDENKEKKKLTRDQIAILGEHKGAEGIDEANQQKVNEILNKTMSTAFAYFFSKSTGAKYKDILAKKDIDVKAMLLFSGLKLLNLNKTVGYLNPVSYDLGDKKVLICSGVAVAGGAGHSVSGA